MNDISHEGGNLQATLSKSSIPKIKENTGIVSFMAKEPPTSTQAIMHAKVELQCALEKIDRELNSKEMDNGAYALALYRAQSATAWLETAFDEVWGVVDDD